MMKGNTTDEPKHRPEPYDGVDARDGNPTICDWLDDSDIFDTVNPQAQRSVVDGGKHENRQNSDKRRWQ